MVYILLLMIHTYDGCQLCPFLHMIQMCQQILLEYQCPFHHMSQQILLEYQSPIHHMSNNDMSHHPCMGSITFGDTTDKGNLVEVKEKGRMRKRQYQPINPYYHTSA